MRAGTYQGAIHPRFRKVGLVGHSLGGSIAQVEAYSFRDVDAIGVLAYADAALTPSILLGSANWALKCVTGGARSDGGAAGYAHLTKDVADYRRNFLARTPAAVLAKATALRDLNPCGDLLSAVPAVAVSLLRIAQIKVPVLVMSGSQDLVFDPQRVKLQAGLYLGASSRTVNIVEGATHGITLEPTVTAFVAGLDVWLRRQGL